MSRKVLVIAGAVVLAIIVAAAALHARAGGVPVEFAEARTAPLVTPLSTDGVVESIEVDLAPEASGSLRELYVHEGATVTLGEVVALVSDEKAQAAVAEAKAALQAAEAEVEIASADLDRQRGESKAAVDGAQATEKIEKAQLDKARSGPLGYEIARAEAAVEAARADVWAAEAGVEAARAALKQAEKSAAAQKRMAGGELAAAQARLEQLTEGPRAQEIEQARAALDAARAEATNRERQYERAGRLHAQGAISKAELDDAQAAMLSAKANREARTQALELLREGSRSEDIAAARGSVEAARGTVAEAEASSELVEVRRKELTASEARLRQAKAILEQNRQYVLLLVSGTREEDVKAQEQKLALAKAQKDAARTSFKATEAAIHRLSVAIARQKQARATLQAASTTLAETVVKSPTNGVVSVKHVDVGAIVGPQVPIVTIVNREDVWVMADVDDEDISRIREGQVVRVLCEAYPDRVFAGKVESVGGAALPKGVGRVKAKIVRVRISVAGGAEVLKPGMAVDIAADTQLKDQALLVPADAVFEEGADSFVYVIKQGLATKVKVETGFSNYTQTEILGGVVAGDRVVVSGKDAISDGVRVRARKAPEPEQPVTGAAGPG
ncbi:MAG TPA: hypothetical protein DGT21_07225 [Armatimonadetes bacterium]|jgi:RND family efflux transporter MFP subunit|nr:hypothetical protein [Armatimonadota bacterium]